MSGRQQLKKPKHVTEISERDLKNVALKPSQRAYHDRIISNEITFCYGPAGTSKTFTACLAALDLYIAGKIKIQNQRGCQYIAALNNFISSKN